MAFIYISPEDLRTRIEDAHGLRADILEHPESYTDPDVSLLDQQLGELTDIQSIAEFTFEPEEEFGFEFPRSIIAVAYPGGEQITLV